ncbi:MAG: hypothetical protein Q3997_07750 [Propionibacteriaceae bacterium]|nr:hypothetical protein [Propionibacteriaceae bacterium]
MIVGGGTLGAAAAAARLAKLGHTVTLSGTPGCVGGHWRTSLPPVITLPATWRDTFRKSGRTLEAELARAGLSLVAAPPTIHRFPDGLSFALPTERGAQHRAISGAFGPAAADRWRDLIDRLDDVWLALRRAGIEEPRPDRCPKDLAARLWRGLTLADLAEQVREPHLGAIISSLGPRCGTDSPRAPALLATRLVVDRTFGRWQLASQDRPAGATALLDALEARLATRKVTIVADAGPPDLDLSPVQPPRPWFGRGLRAALAPQVSYPEATPGEAAEVVTHSPSGLVVDWPGLRHDFGATRHDIAWGYAPDRWAAWWARPLAWSAGNEPWAELASAALAVYDYHLRRTGADVRPANKEYRP